MSFHRQCNGRAITINTEQTADGKYFVSKVVVELGKVGKVIAEEMPYAKVLLVSEVAAVARATSHASVYMKNHQR
jgi:hypothetical protein